jgi:hypothetical protein
MKALGWVAVATVFSFLCLIFGAEIDGVFRIVSSHDLQTVKRLPTPSGLPLEQLIEKRYTIRKWNAYHFDELYRTVVDCEATSERGVPVTLSWEVGHFFSPHPKLPRQRLFLCALTREAAEVTPWLTPPGLPPNRYPETEARVFHSTALFGDLGR